MSTPAKSRRGRAPQTVDAAAASAASDEVLEVMFWLRGEGFAHEVSPGELAKWVGLEARAIESLLVRMLGTRLVERVVVDSGAEEGVPRFRLTRDGVREGERRFAEEFAELSAPRHFEHSDPACHCEGVSRFSVSLKKGLFRELDEMIRAKGYENRSLAIADMIRDQLVEYRQGADGDGIAVGTIMVAYDPRAARVRATFGELQEEYLETIVSTMRVQSDPRSAMEVFVVRGKAAAIQTLADRLIGAKGVKHGKLSLTVSEDLPA